MAQTVRGANSGFLRNGQLWSTDSSGCLRTILLRDRAIEPAKDEKTQKVFNIGFYNENLFKAELEHYGIPFRADVAVDEPLRETIAFEGHADFLVYNGNEPIVYELKSVTSPNTYKKVFEKGEFKYSNLAQLLRYMLVTGTSYGVLRYTSFMEAITYKEIGELSWDEILIRLKAIEPESRQFQVEIHEDGHITVDGETILFDVFDSIAHTEAAAYILEKNQVFPDRPKDARGETPCHFCKFRDVCDRFDEARGQMTTEQFLNLAEEATKE